MSQRTNLLHAANAFQPAGELEILRREVDLLQSASSDCLLRLDDRLMVTWANPTAEKELRPGCDLLARRIDDLMPNLLDSDVFMIDDSPPFEFRDGENRWLEARAVACWDGWLLILRDISRKMRTHSELRASRQTLAGILDSIPQIVWKSGEGADCAYINRRWHEFTGRESVDSGLDWLEAIHPDDRETAIEAWRQAALIGRLPTFRHRLVTKDGTYRWVRVDAAPQLSEDGALLGWYGTCTDIHDQVLAEDELRKTEALNQSILNSSPDCIKLMTLDGQILYCNPLGPRALDLDEGTDLVGMNWFELVEPDAAEMGRAAVAAAGRGVASQFTVQQTTAKGRLRWFNILVSPVCRQDRSTDSIVFVARDISDLKEAEAEASRKEALYRGVLEASADCIKILDIEGRLEVMNTPGQRAFEVADLEPLTGQPWSMMWPEDARKMVTKAVEDARAGKVARFSGFCPTMTGMPKWWDVVVSPMRENGKVARLLAISRDVTETRRAAEELRRVSEQDALTELPNRRSFETRLEASVMEANASGQSVGLLIIDLDRFKHVNDSLGHSAGDHLLRSFAERLRSAVRSSDHIARIGGDEFAVILEDVRGGEDLTRVGEAILTRLQPQIAYQGRSFSAGASIGGAIFPRHARNARDLFNSADTALYYMKETGRGGTCMFQDGMREHVQRIASQLNLARLAVSTGAISPHYQPKFHLASGRLSGFEALLRWKHPSRGLQTPDTIAEAFRDYELASKMGAMMQESVFAQAASWTRAGLPFGRLAINAAPSEFLRGDYAERLLARLEHFGLRGDHVEVEVTEHVFLEQGAELVSRSLDALSNAGIRIALDDFGTGYSSLSHLRDFPVHVVKIDKSFIEKMLSDSDIAAIVSSVIGLAKKLGIEVVAEGVEQESQASYLRDRGCDIAQGYLYGRPLDEGEARRILERIPRPPLDLFD